MAAVDSPFHACRDITSLIQYHRLGVIGENDRDAIRRFPVGVDCTGGGYGWNDV